MNYQAMRGYTRNDEGATQTNRQRLRSLSKDQFSPDYAVL